MPFSSYYLFLNEFVSSIGCFIASITMIFYVSFDVIYFNINNAKLISMIEGGINFNINLYINYL